MSGPEDDELSRLRARNTELESTLATLRARDRAHEEQRELALRVAGIGFFSFDLASQAGDMDETTKRVLGLDPRESAPTLEATLAQIHEDDRERWRTAVSSVAEKGAVEIEHRVRRPDGSIGWVRAVGKLPAGSSRLVGVVIDLTTHKAIQTRLAQAQRMDGIGLLAGGIAHDFNNLLTVILGATTRAAMLAPEGSMVQESLREAIQAAERSVTLTSQLLAFARQREIAPRVVSLRDVIGGLERLLRNVVGPGIVFETQVAATARVKVDPHQLEQALLNLVINARDAMPRGGRLRIGTEDEAVAPGGEIPAGRYVRLVVSDEGVGISPEVLPHIFEPFYTTKGTTGGTGLGLATVYGIVRQHEGHVHVASEPGKGTRFEIRLPAITAPEEKREPGARTVLVVEDERHVRAVVVMTLKRYGYSVLEAGDGEEALVIARSHAGPIDLLLSDVMLPRTTGPEVAVRLKVVRPEMRVLFMSGYAEVGFDTGTELLAKPFTPSTLAEKVRTVLERG